MKLNTKSMLLGAIASSVAFHAYAQPETQQLEEIVVTAQRRETRLQDTPISVTALTASALEARGIRNLNALDSYTPNLQLNNGKPDGGGSAASATIRGVGQNDFQFPNDPGVGTYIDGVYLARTLGGLMSIMDVERVEVLRGPQGTLFGRNTIGGAINITTQPPKNDFGGTASLTYGSYNRVEAKGSVNLPLIDGKLAARISAGIISADGLGEQIPTGVQLANEDRKIVRFALRATPSDDVTIDFAADYTRQRQNGGALKFIPNFPSTSGLTEGIFNPILAPIQNAQLGLPAGTVFDSRWVTSGRYDNYGMAPQRDWFDAGGAALTVTWKASDALTLKSITAGRAIAAQIFTDLDTTPYSIVDTHDKQHDEQYSQEFQAYGSLMNGRVDYLLGGYFFKELARDRNSVHIYPGTLQTVGFEISQIADLGLDVTNYAGFGQVGFTIVDGLKFTVGFRENYEQKRLNREFTHLEGGDVFIPYQVLSKSWRSFTPKFGLDWKPSRDILVYASYAEGFKSGGWNPRPLSVSAGERAFNPETIKTYEIGTKTQWLDRRLTLNLTSFYSKYSDIQLQALIGLPDGTITSDTQNAGKVTIKGAEAELVAKPIPEASIQISAGYIDNKYTELSPGTDVKIWNKLPDTPKWTLNFGADYVFNFLGLGELTPRVDVSYRSTIYKDAVNSPEIAQSGYWLTNARISFVPERLNNLQLELYGTNIFDKKYISYGQNIGANGFSVAGYGRPREIGVTAKYKF